MASASPSQDLGHFHLCWAEACCWWINQPKCLSDASDQRCASGAYKGPRVKHLEVHGPHEDILMIVDFSEKDWDYQKPIVAAEWMPLHSKRMAAHHRTNMFCCLHSDFSFFLSPSLSLHDFVDFLTYRTYVLGVEYSLGIIYILSFS